MSIVSLIFVGCIAAYTATAAVLDVRLHRIPNYLTVPAALLGFAYHTLAPEGWGWFASLAGLGVGLALLVVPWLLGGGGAGDVKLLAALGAWLGPQLMLISFAISAVLAGAMVLAVLTWAIATQGFSKVHTKHLQRDPDQDRAAHRRRRLMPFAVPVALSTWMVLAWLVTFGNI